MRYVFLAAAAFLAACATTPVDDRAFEYSPGVAWVAAGEDWADEAETVFDAATEYVLEEAATRPANSWAVVLDLDETVINNVRYQMEREQLGEGYTPQSWYDWTQREEATLVPGVEAFLETVNDAGGHVAFVTNRSDSEQLATENNLAALGITRHDDFRVLMTRARPGGASEKDARYDLVPALLATQGYPDVSVIAYLGDNIGDKPANEGDWTFFCIDQGAMYGDPCAAVPGPGR